MGRLWHYQQMAHGAPNPAQVYGVSRRDASRHAEHWAVELLHEELSQEDRSDEVRAAQHELFLEREEQELASKAVGQDPNAPMPWDADWQPPESSAAAGAVDADVDDLIDDWIPPDVNAAFAHKQRMLALAKAAHSLMPTLRAADRILAPTVLAAQAAHAHELIRTLTARREQLAALLLARLRAIAATLAAQLLPAPRTVAFHSAA